MAMFQSDNADSDDETEEVSEVDLLQVKNSYSDLASCWKEIHT